MKIILILLAILGVNLATGSAAEVRLQPREWALAGMARKALVSIPSSAQQQPAPVVFAFHGHGGTMAQASRSFEMHVLWPEAIVIYMQGLPTSGMTDPEGKKSGWQKAPGDYADRDLKFFDVVWATLKAEAKVDARRVFATGHSNGGQFTYSLWAMRGDVFTAMAPSAAAPGVGWYERLKAKPALHLAGTNDELVKFTVQDRTMKVVRKLNSCAPEAEAWAKSGSITGTIYRSATGTPFVALIYPGTHKYPAEAPALIAKFFTEQMRE